MRAPLATLALALYLIGSHLCLVAAVARAHGGEVPMSCASVASVEHPVAHACCGGAAAREDAPVSRPSAPRPAAPPESPCCLLLVTASAPALDLAAAHAPCALVADEPAALPLAPVLASVGALAADEHAPPGASPRAPLPARAPPALA